MSYMPKEPVVSYIPPIAWRIVNRKGNREIGIIRDSSPPEAFATNTWGDGVALTISRLRDVGHAIVLGRFATVEKAKAAAQAHLDAGPTRDDRLLPVESAGALILRGRQQRIRELCMEAMAVDPPAADKDPTKLAPESFLGVKITRILDGALDDYIKERDAL